MRFLIIILGLVVSLYSSCDTQPISSSSIVSSESSSWSWTWYFCKVIFDSQGADIPASPSSYLLSNGSYSHSIPEPLVPSKGGHVFSGWWTMPNGGGISTTNSAFYDITTNYQKISMYEYYNEFSLYAYWRSNYTVSFNSMGGTSVSNCIVTSNDFIPEPVAPTNTGFALRGWYIDSNYSMQWNFTNFRILSNVNLYAKWLIVTPGLSYSKIGLSEVYSVSKGVADTFGNVIISEYWDSRLVSEIGIFSNCVTMTNITLPISIKSIGAMAFFGCSGLKPINIPNNVTNIGLMAFSFCNFTNFILPDSIVNINAYAFSSCYNLNSINMPSNILFVGDNAFSYTAIKNIVFPDNNIFIGERVFAECRSLTNVRLSTNTVSIKKFAFLNCTNLKYIVIPNRLTNIAYGLFSGCELLTNVILSTNVMLIDSESFRNCTNLKQITLPMNLKQINSYAFEYAISLTNIIIPSSVSYIGDRAFLNCRLLKTVTINVTNPPIVGVDIFTNCTNLNAIKVPAGSVTTYKTTDGWSAYSNKIISQ